MMDHLSHFLKEEFFATFSGWWKAILGMGGGLIPSLLMFYELRDIAGFPKNISSMKLLLYSFLSLVVVFTVIFIFRLIRRQINTKIQKLEMIIKTQNEQVLLPSYLSIKDIKPYIIEETKMIKHYKFNPDAVSFDVHCEIFYKVRICNDSFEFFETRYNSGYCSYKESAFKQMNIKLKQSFYNGYKLICKVVSSTEHEHIIQVRLADKTIHVGEQLEFSLEFTYVDYQFLSYEELESFITHKMHPKQERVETSRVGDIGMNKLGIDIYFPAKYPFALPNLDVVSQSNISVSKEKERLKEYFRPNSTAYEKSIKFEVTQPVVGLSYKITWVPPSLDSLLECGFLNNEETIKLKQNAKIS